MKKPYLELLKAAPDHASEAFLTFLRMKNKVIYEDDIWLIIQNYKYHEKKNPWHTAFLKQDADIWYMYMPKLLDDYSDWDIIIKGEPRRTVGRFHIHLIKKPVDLPKEVLILPKEKIMVPDK